MAKESTALVMPTAGPAMFVGTFHACCEHVWQLDPAGRAQITIWTEEVIYTASDVEALREDCQAYPSPPHAAP